MTTVSTTEGEGKFLGLTPINASEEDMESLRQFLDSKVSDSAKTVRVKQLFGGYCIVCTALPTQIATYDYVGATRIDDTVIHVRRRNLVGHDQ